MDWKQEDKGIRESKAIKIEKGQSRIIRAIKWCKWNSPENEPIIEKLLHLC